MHHATAGSLNINKNHHILYIITGSSLFLLSGLFFLNLLYPFVVDNSYADSSSVDVSVTLAPTISISTDVNKVDLDISASDFEDLVTGDVTVNVGTNNAYGYTLSVSAEGSETALVNKDNNNLKIPTLSNETTSTTWTNDTNLNNTWGFTHNNTDILTTGTYLPMVASNTDGDTTVKVTSEPKNSSETKVTFATKVDKTQLSGDYSSKIIFSAVANSAPTPTLQNMTPETCAALDIYSSSKPDSTTYTFRDARDNQEYHVRRLYMTADHMDSPPTTACWMVDNLRLTYDTLPKNHKTLTSSDTNLDEDFTFIPQNTDTWCTSSDEECINTPNHIISDITKYGAYYNWYTATVASGISSTIGSSAPASICPGKGANTSTWHLPSGGGGANGGEWYKLYQAYQAAYGWAILNGYDPGNNIVNNLSTTIGPDFVYSGQRTHGKGSGAWWWTRTVHPNSINAAYSADLNNAGYVYGGVGGDSKWHGYAVRCVLTSS